MELQQVLQYLEGQIDKQPPVKFIDCASMANVMNAIEPLNYDQAKDKEEK